MFTPQQIEQISFSTQTFNGYNIQQVDELLEPLTEDYITLYKENALLKSKMKVLVTKLEEYRKSEASMRDAIINAQKTCDMMVKEAEAKCTQMLNEANQAAAENARNADALIAAENARVEEAKRAAAQKIREIEAQLHACMQALVRIREANAPAPQKAPSRAAFDYESAEQPRKSAASSADAMADEISQNVEALVGTTDDPAPKAEPRHPASSSTTSKFNNLQFGRNYDPTHGNGDSDK